MLTFAEFTGINNVLPEHRMSSADLMKAENVDIGLTGEISRRAGYTEVSPDCHKNLWQALGFMLATSGGPLVAIHPGGARHTIHPALGSDRVWYCNLPDGRTVFSNGLIHGATDGLSGFDIAVPPLGSLGVPDVAAGGLHPGNYRYHLTRVRLSDGAESPAVSSQPLAVTGGFRVAGLEQRDGHAVNVYLSGLDGEGAYLAGSTQTDVFEYGGDNTSLVLPCRTLGTVELPVGKWLAYWRGRLLTAVGSTLWASRPSAPHLCDWRDFKSFDSEITAVLPTSGGVFVGTRNDLIYLGGTTFDQLAYVPTELGGVTPGSGVSAPGERLRAGDGVGSGDAAVCIAGGWVVACLPSGQAVKMTSDRYRCDAKEVSATFREVNGIPQYMAVPQ